MTNQQQLDDDRLTEIAESHPGDWYGGEWRTEYIDSTDDQSARYVVKHAESGHVLAELPDFAGPIALFIADAHDAVPELVAEVRRLREQLAATQTKTLATEADEIIAHCPDHGSRDTTWMHCHCAVADDIRRRAAAPAEESHVVADDSDDPEHVDDCPGCEAFTLTGHRAAPAARSAAV